MEAMFTYAQEMLAPFAFLTPEDANAEVYWKRHGFQQCRSLQAPALAESSSSCAASCGAGGRRRARRYVLRLSIPTA